MINLAASCFGLITAFFFLLVPIISLSAPLSEDEGSAEQSVQVSKADVRCGACLSFNDLDKKIRDGAISRSAARTRLTGLLPALRDYYYEAGGRDFSPREWVFPVEGYTSRAIGGRGRGYKAKGYDYFDGNRHKAHPSHDIFMRDRNRDQVDDVTRKAVRVLSMTGGLVAATETTWEPGSKLRGGKYIWIYNPTDNALVYYAHNRELLVNPGDIVKPGDPIAVMGRTGLNAAKPRSPTHLHITYLKVKDGYPVPVNIYNRLLSSRQ